MRILITLCLVLGLWLGQPLSAAASLPPPEQLLIDVMVPEEDSAYQHFRQQMTTQRLQYPLSVQLREQLREHAETGKRHILLVLGNRAWQQLDTVPPFYEITIAVYVDAAVFHARLPETRADMPLTALFRGAPPERQLRLVRELLPTSQRLGLPYDPARETALPELEQLAQVHGFQIDRVPLTADTQATSLRRLTQQNDAILALPELQGLTPDNVRSLLLAAYRQGRPVIGMDPAYVQAGLLATTYTPPLWFVDDVESLLRQWLNHQVLPAPGWPARFAVMLNQRVARSLNQTLPDETRLRERLGSSDTTRQQP